MDSYFRLIYASKVTEPINADALLAQAQRNNPGHGITGGLAILNGVYLEYLEGSEEEVERLFERISRDVRHTNIKVLERRPISRRMFNNWSMATLLWTTTTKNIFHSFSPGVDFNLHDMDPTTAAPLFRAWAATAEWKS
jgi:hypothetical protein